MPKQPQTISFELAEKFANIRLPEKYESLFDWYLEKDSDEPLLMTTYKKYDSYYYHNGAKFYSAYQLHEILEMLPFEIEQQEYKRKFCDTNGRLIIDKNNQSFNFYYNLSDYDDYLPFINFEHENPAEAAGNLLLWCIENNYVKI